MKVTELVDSNDTDNHTHDLGHQTGDAHELSDSDYPPVYGEPVFERSPNAAVLKAELEAITEQLEPSEALVDSHNVNTLLKKAGYLDISENDIQSLNIFPSPMDAFQYALYTFGQTDIYIVLMVNIRQRSIYGHHILDLTQNYSLIDDLIDRLKNKDFLL